MKKYQKFPKIALPNRKWPDREITQAPIWCSVDLLDGNQALVNPMSLEQKVAFFNLLVAIGFKEIEIGFPSASEIEYAFCRHLIEHDLIPEDVTISVLTQAREHLIQKSAKALKGAKRVIVHLYNSTSTMQREVVFQKSQEEILQMALDGVAWVKEAFGDFEGEVRLEYSPESFSQTELDFAAKICNSVVDAWDPQAGERVILNLPATVEAATPNIYADQIEWMIGHIKRREDVLVSLHAHNDRGTAVAATELALMAGADRVEGTLLGNGERTGNVDIVTLALNMYTQGIDPKLDMGDIDRIVEMVEAVTEIKTHPRHPYVGELVYTAFSGSHQDAIKKGMAQQKEGQRWYVPYLPIDPKDVGRSYASIIRVNAQSGKGGIAYLLEEEFGFKIPKKMQPILAQKVQVVSDSKGGVLSSEEIFAIFKEHFLNQNAPFWIENLKVLIGDERVELAVDLCQRDQKRHFVESASGIIEALSNIVEQSGVDFRITCYEEHALGKGRDAKAVAYFEIEREGQSFWGAGEGENISYASIYALLSAINQSFTK